MQNGIMFYGTECMHVISIWCKRQKHTKSKVEKNLKQKIVHKKLLIGKSGLNPAQIFNWNRIT